MIKKFFKTIVCVFIIYLYAVLLQCVKDLNRQLDILKDQELILIKNERACFKDIGINGVFTYKKIYECN